MGAIGGEDDTSKCHLKVRARVRMGSMGAYSGLLLPVF